MKISPALSVVAFFLFCSVLVPNEDAYSKVISVSISNNSGNEDGSILFPYNTIQEGINAAVAGDTVLVRPGTYFENIVIDNKNLVLGSLYLTSSDRTYINNTIIDGHDAGKVLMVHYSPRIIITGFTIQHGFLTDYGGAGIHTIDAYGEISNCNIINNTNTIENDYYAAGLACMGGDMTIKNCTITGNVAIHGVAALLANWGTIHITNSIIASDTGKISIHLGWESGSVYNSTITQNSGDFFAFGSNIAVRNCIVWKNNNSVNYLNYLSDIAFTDVDYQIAGTGNLSVNPLFTDPDHGDYHLRLSSYCIDAGNPDMSDNDVDGSRNDMGSYGGPNGTSYAYLDGSPIIDNIVISPKYLDSHEMVSITAKILDVPASVNSVHVDFENPDENVLASLPLFDDGNHADNAAGDGIFGNSIADNWIKGAHYLIDFQATDNNGLTSERNNAASIDIIPVPDTVKIPYTDTPIKIDGSGNDETWNNLPFIPIAKLQAGEVKGPADLSGRYKVCWDLDSLYLFVDVTDDSLDNIHGIWYGENDRIELYLDIKNNRSHNNIPEDLFITYAWQNGSYSNRPLSGNHFVEHTNPQRDGYQLEAAISLKDAGYPMQDLVGMDIRIGDRDGFEATPAIMDWNTVIYADWWDKRTYGEASLLDFKERMPAQAIKVIDLVDFPACVTVNGLVKVKLFNFGSETIPQFQISYSLNGTAIQQAETAYISIAPGDTVEYTFVTPANLAFSGNYSIYVSTLLDGGNPHANFSFESKRMVFGNNSYKNWSDYSNCNGLPDNSGRFLLTDSHHDMWVAASGGVEKMNSSTGTWTIYNSANGGLIGNPLALAEDHAGNIWAALDNMGYARFDGTNWSIHNDIGNVLTVFVDHLGNIWFGTWGNGVFKLEPSTNTFTNYRIENSGISGNIIWYGGIMEDSKHNMWFGAVGGFGDEGGLTKFDGINWTVYRTNNSGIPSNGILCSLMDAQDNVWLGFGWNGMGLCRFDGQNWSVFNTANSGISTNQIYCSMQDKNHNIWSGSDNGLNKYNGNVWQTFNSSNSGLINSSIASIAEDHSGDIWVATANGLFKYDVPDTSLKVTSVVDFPICGSASDQIKVKIKNTGARPVNPFRITYSINGKSIVQAETVNITIPAGDTVEYAFTTRANLSITGSYDLIVNTLLDGGNPEINESLETKQFVFGIDTVKNWRSYDTCNGFPSNYVRFVRPDSHGNVWVGTAFNGLAKLDKNTGNWTNYNVINSGFSNNNAITVFEDHLGNIWAGFDQEDGIVEKFDGTSWTANNPANVHVLCIFEDHAGNMWFGTWGDGVRKWDRSSDTWTTYTTQNSGLPSNEMWYGSIMEDSNHNMWFGTIGHNGSYGEGGLVKFDGTAWTLYNAGNSPLPTNLIIGSLMDSHGNIWMAHGWDHKGVTKYDGSNWINYNTGNSGLVSDYIYNINEDNQGNIWFGSFGQGMSKFDGTTWKNFNTDNSGLTSNNVASVAEDSKGYIWVATWFGLDRYDQGNVTHFSKVWSGNGMDHMNFYALSAKIDGADMQPGDEIGIFDGSVCVGSGVMTQTLNGSNFLEIRVSRDDPSTTEKDGYTPGNAATFKLWDASAQQEISTYDIIYITGSNTYEIGASTWYQIGGYTKVDQQIPLLNGWNIFSLYVTPDNPAMMNIVQPLINEGSLVKVQNEAGGAIEAIPGLGLWIDNIGNWRNTEGYKIRVNKTTSLTAHGLPVKDPVNIDLLTGWNIIGYPASSPQQAMTVLNNLISNHNLLKVQDETGAAIEPMPFNLGWIDNIHNFNAGEGYKVRVASNDNLTITPSASGSLKSALNGNRKPVHFINAWEGNGVDHMNIYLSLSGENGTLLHTGDEVGIYDGAVCVGSGVITNPSEKYYSFVVSADDPTTDAIDGFVKGNAMSFKIWQNDKQAEATITGVEFLPDYKGIFDPLGTAVAGVHFEASTCNVFKTSLGDNYPNPFQEETTIPFTIGAKTSVELAVYDMLGQRVTTLVHATMEPGSYNVTWSGTHQGQEKVKPGVYLCKMMAGSYASVKTIEITR
jgi:ligand-binding sensor domain-containing protein